MSFSPPSQSLFHWSQVGVCPHHGINVFLPSLKSRASEKTGGNFGDLLQLLDWVKEIGFNTIQLLPLNDSGSDPSPYNALSAYAINPCYITPGKALIDKDDPQFKAFCSSNDWVKPYALFKVLKEKNGFKAHWEWPLDQRQYSDKLLASFKAEAEAVCLVQYQAHVELKTVKDEASKRGLLLMGDLPILISPDSADVWSKPQLFNNQFAAGVPPDMYEKEGQYWGFPLYNVENMQKENFHWWKERLAIASSYFHLYRIDHVVGLFRLWAIPKGSKAKNGFYIPSLEKDWLAQGRHILKEFLESCALLPIAEDLGVIPPSVRATLNEYGIPGTKVMRWEREWEKEDSFINPESYSPCSLTTISTHDSETLAQWWESDPKAVSLYCRTYKRPYNPVLNHDDRFFVLRQSHKSGSLFHVNLLGEYLALFDDLVYNQKDMERINIPGRVNETNWRLRTRPYLEDIIHHEGLKSAMKALIC